MAGGTKPSWQWGAPANYFISSAASGKHGWVTSLAGNHNNDELSYLESPVFDFSALEDTPVLKFRFIHELEKEYDGSWLEGSTDGGNTWVKLGEGLLYNNETKQWWDGASGTQPGSWKQTSLLLTGFEGMADVRFRFVMNSDGVYPLEGFGLDKVEVFDALTDGKLNGIANIGEINCGLGKEELLTVKVENTGNKSFSDFKICVELEGQTVCEQVPDTLASLKELSYTFTKGVDLSAYKTHAIKAYLQVAEDKVPENDTLRLNAVNASLISRFSYLENFEVNEGGWGAYGENSSWTYRSSEAANSYWANGEGGQYNNAETSFLESPCLDFSEVKVNPKLEFKLKYQTEEVFDGLWLEVSKDGGLSWNKVRNAGEAVNWYNNAEKEWWDGTSQPASEWITASLELTGVSGKPDVKLRFAFAADENVNGAGVAIDDLLIAAPLYENLGGELFACGALDTLLDAGNPGAEYLWSTGETGRQLQYSRAEIGADTLWVDITNDFGTLRDSLVVYISTFEMAELADTIVCQDSFVRLTPELSFNGPVAPEVAYYWYRNNTLTGTHSDTFDFYPSDSESETLVFYAEAFQGGCFLTDTLVIRQVKEPRMQVTVKKFADAKGEVEFKANGATGKYEWLVEGAESYKLEGIGPHTIQFSEAGTYEVSLLAEIEGCYFEKSDSFIVEQVLAVSPERSGIESLKLFPNPNKGSFKLEYQVNRPQQVSYQLFNLSGQVVWEAKFMEEGEVTRRIDIARNLPAGMYTLLLNGPDFSERSLIAID